MNGPYEYDGAGNIKAIGSEQFVYDKLGRLRTATVRGPDLSVLQTQTITYDDYGNITSTSKLGQTVDLSTNTASNHLFSAGYDASGNITTSGSELYDYDATGMMNQVRLGASQPPRVIYAYTADDQRLFVFDVSTGITHWTLRGLDNKVLRDFKQQGTTWKVERDYIYRDGHLLAGLTPGGAAEHYSLDHLGTPRLLTDATGQKVAYHAYWPFGEEWSPGNAQEGNPLKFTGHERDSDPVGGNSPLDYMHARYFDSTAGRFLSVDPSVDVDKNAGEPQRWNGYSYVTNNPVSFTDPDGRDKFASFVMGIVGGPRAAEAYKNVSTWDALFGRGVGRDMQQRFRDTPTSFKVEAEVTIAILSLTRGPVAQTFGNVLGFARSSAVNSWMNANSSRIDEKLGRKLGTGDLPSFERSKEGAAQARDAIRSTLADADAVKSNPFPTRGGNTVTDIYSEKTGMTVRIRQDGTFDTLIEGPTGKIK